MACVWRSDSLTTPRSTCLVGSIFELRLIHPAPVVDPAAFDADLSYVCLDHSVSQLDLECVCVDADVHNGHLCLFCCCGCHSECISLAIGAIWPVSDPYWANSID